jgi:hypothetical protein
MTKDTRVKIVATTGAKNGSEWHIKVDKGYHVDGKDKLITDTFDFYRLNKGEFVTVQRSDYDPDISFHLSQYPNSKLEFNNPNIGYPYVRYWPENIDGSLFYKLSEGEFKSDYIKSSHYCCKFIATRQKDTDTKNWLVELIYTGY